MKQIRLLTSLLFVSATSVHASETTQPGYNFSEGSAIILCQMEEGIPTDNFNKAFPEWSKVLHDRHNDGSVKLVQFTKELNKGVLVLINAAKKNEDNLAQAKILMNELNTISQRNGIESVSACEAIPLGPIWLSPKN